MPRNVVEVRRAGVGDADALLDVVHQLRTEAGRQHVRTEGSSVRSRLLAALARPDVDVLVAWSGQEPVGLAVLRVGELVPLSGASALHVDQLFVLPAWRRRSVGHQLLAAAAAAAERDGLVDVVCATPAGGREVHRFLARLGFLPLVTHRVVAASTLRRRVASALPAGVRAVPGGSGRRTPVQVLLARRRRERGRAAAAAGPEALPAEVGVRAGVGVPAEAGVPAEVGPAESVPAAGSGPVRELDGADA